MDEGQQIPVEQKALQNQTELTGDLTRGEAESPWQMPQATASSGIYRGNETAEAASGEEEWQPWVAGSCWDNRHCRNIQGLAVIRPL